MKHFIPMALSALVLTSPVFAQEGGPLLPDNPQELERARQQENLSAFDSLRQRLSTALKPRQPTPQEAAAAAAAASAAEEAAARQAEAASQNEAQAEQPAPQVETTNEVAVEQAPTVNARPADERLSSWRKALAQRPAPGAPLPENFKMGPLPADYGIAATIAAQTSDGWKILDETQLAGVAWDWVHQAEGVAQLQEGVRYIMAGREKALAAIYMSWFEAAYLNPSSAFLSDSELAVLMTMRHAAIAQMIAFDSAKVYKAFGQQLLEFAPQMDAETSAAVQRMAQGSAP